MRCCQIIFSEATLPRSHQGEQEVHLSSSSPPPLSFLVLPFTFFTFLLLSSSINFYLPRPPVLSSFLLNLSSDVSGAIFPSCIISPPLRTSPPSSFLPAILVPLSFYLSCPVLSSLSLSPPLFLASAHLVSSLCPFLFSSLPPSSHFGPVIASPLSSLLPLLSPSIIFHLFISPLTFTSPSTSCLSPRYYSLPLDVYHLSSF